RYAQYFPKLPGQKFEYPSFEEEILSFIRDLGHTGEIKVLSDVNVNHLHKPWRSFAAIINKCLSGKTTALENLVYQVENKNSKKNNDMYYPRFTKVIVDYFMAKDQAIPKRNKMFWHYARDDLMFTIIRVISKHQDTQTSKLKSTKKKADSESSTKMKPTQASKGKRIKTSAKGDIPAKKKQSATKSKSLTVLFEGALTETEHMKIALERSKTKQHNSHKSRDEEDGDEVNMGDDNDDDADNQDDDDQEHDDQDDEEQDDVNEQTNLDNDGDDFVHPKLSTYDEEYKEEGIQI
ncbi:hypothetical protein Tco_1011421, partial [Tanacetum coccineum]